MVECIDCDGLWDHKYGLKGNLRGIISSIPSASEMFYSEKNISHTNSSLKLKIKLSFTGSKLREKSQ